MSEWRRFIAPAAVVLLTPAAGYSAQYLTIKEAQVLCFPAATAFEPAPLMLTPEQRDRVESESGQRVPKGPLQMWRAMLGERVLGYFVFDSVIGKHDLIDYGVALAPDGAVKQVEILEYRETYGGEIRNEAWRRQFVGKRADSELRLAGDIKNISGATLSTRHITEGVKRILVTFHAVMQ